jgi:hypothetical protein
MLDYLRLFSGAQAKKVGNQKKIVKAVLDPNSQILKLSQICRRIELCMRGIIRSLEMNM